MSAWVLKDELHGYLERWISDFGPAMTKDVGSAMQFRSKEDATGHPAYSFPLTFLKPQEIEQ